MDYYGVKMTIPKKLEEKRDELATEKKQPYNETYKPIVGAMVCVGFDEACNLLLPEIKKLEEALTNIKDSNVPSDHDWIMAYEALKSLREFLGSEAENE